MVRSGGLGGALVVCLVLSAAPLGAHDLWIEPATFQPDVGALVSLRLRVGVDFIGDPVPRDPNLVKQFVYADARGLKPVVGRDRADPAGLVRIEAPGTIVAGYYSHPSRVEQTAEKFNQYLEEEGLDQVAAIRARRNQTGHGVNELFSRCAKTLIEPGRTGEGRGDQVLGFPLELVAEQNPYTLRTGQELAIRLTYEGRPLSGVQVVAMNRLNPAAKQTARTDARGRVQFRLDRAGAWLVKAVHMVAAPEGAKADWASYWASLTFEHRNPS